MSSTGNYSYATRLRNAFNTVCEVYQDMDHREKYTFKSQISSEDYFRLKGLYLQATSGDVGSSAHPWKGCNSQYLTFDAHREFRGMSKIKAMEEYLLIILSDEFRNDTCFGEWCHDALLGDRILDDLGIED